MNKKGFTLIELLAVLLILAIIALIVTPIISKIIATAKDSADRRSVERYVRAAQTFYMESQVDENKKTHLNSNIIEQLDLEDIEATGSIIAYTDGGIEMALIYNSKCYTKSITQSVKNIEVSTDLDNCSVSSSNVLVSNIQSNENDIVLTIDPSKTPGVTLTSCKYGTTNGQYTIDGTIDGNNCTFAPTSVGVRYFYELTFSDGSKRYGSIQGGSGSVTPNNTTVAENPSSSGSSSSGSSSSGSGSGGSGSGGSSSGGVAAPINIEANGRTVYTGRYLSNAVAKYWNVTTGTKCDVIDFTANGGNNTAGLNSGCLKFWAYMEDNLSYTMIQDRNASNTCVAWASSGNNGSGPVTASAKLKELTADWKGTITPKNYINVYMVNGNESAYRIPYETDGYHARFITSEEIAHITANNAFSSVSTTHGSWFYLDGYASEQSGADWQTQIATATQESAFKWLYNYTAGCANFGCTSTGAPHGYWTSDAIAGSTDLAWFVSKEGKLFGTYFYRYDYNATVNVALEYDLGIRPVITVLKSALD